MPYPLRFHWLFLDLPFHHHHLGGPFHSQALTITSVLEGGEEVGEGEREGGVLPDPWASEQLLTLN